ncbi:MAG: hypothetical protein PHU04_01455 [Candidatus Peribacteraceae bacterium]|nr:hypothetical protein [Candidatus Peribacteraceae bacterium]
MSEGNEHSNGLTNGDALPHDVDAIIRDALEELEPQSDGSGSGIGVSASDAGEGLMGVLRQLHDQGKIECTDVQDMRAEVIADVAYAPELAERHRILSIRRQVADAFYAAIALGDPSSLRELARTLPNAGGFFEELPPEEVERRIADPLFVFAHAGGRIRDPQSLALRDFRFVSDIHIQLPPDDAETAPVTPLIRPDHTRAFYAHDRDRSLKIASEIQSNPAIAACIDNVSVAPKEYRNRRFASCARTELFDHIRENINRERRNKIRYLIAKIFRIQGARVNSGKWQPIESPIISTRSLMMHRFSEVFGEGAHAYCLKGKPLPTFVDCPDQPGKQARVDLGISWETVFMNLDRVEK